MAKSTKTVINEEIKNHMKWTRNYIADIKACVDEGDFKQASYMAMQISACWATLEEDLEKLAFEGSK